MPPIKPENLEAGTMYVIVFSNGVQNTMEFRRIIEEGYPLFLTKDKEPALQNIEGVTYYKVGDPDIPPKPLNAVGGRRRSTAKRSTKAKRSRKNRNRK